MLEMLDAIKEKFSGVQNLWRSLENNAISFYFMPIKDMGLTDEIYITMNSRGKLLTDFEHFKAEFKSRLDAFDAATSNRIVQKIDTTWTDTLWKYRDNKNLIDGGFLNYFKFLCNILLYKKNDTPKNKNRESFFNLLDEFFSGDIQANVEFMEKFFDCWCGIDIGNFFGERVSRGSRSKKIENQSQPGKIILYAENPNLFEDCVRFTGENYPLNKTILLYAFSFYLCNTEKISDKDFRRRIRIVNNLVNNSVSSEISDSAGRQGGNRLPAMIVQVESILLNEKILQRIVPNFNDNQLAEELEKIDWLAQNPHFAESLFALEDHYLLYGQIGIVGLENPQNFKRFISLFSCDYDLIARAFLSGWDYFQHKKKIYQLGSTLPVSWQNLFHFSSYNENFKLTKEYLNGFLEETDSFSENFLSQIIDEYLKNQQRTKNFTWIYYYIKYPEFRVGRYGKYLWNNFKDEPYLFSVLWTEQKQSENAYQPFLKEVDAKNQIVRESFGLRLESEKYFIECENDSYVVKEISSGNVINRLKITQDNGIDAEDRILKFKNWSKINSYGF